MYPRYRPTWPIGIQQVKAPNPTHWPPLPPRISWYSFLEAVSTPGTWTCRMLRKKSPVTRPGIDLGTFRLVAQRLNHYATPGLTGRKISDNFNIYSRLIWHIISVTCSGLSINKQMSTYRSINIRRQIQLHVTSILPSKTVYCTIINVDFTLIKLNGHSLIQLLI